SAKAGAPNSAPAQKTISDLRIDQLDMFDPTINRSGGFVPRLLRYVPASAATAPRRLAFADLEFQSITPWHNLRLYGKNVHTHADRLPLWGVACQPHFSARCPLADN